MRLQTMGDKANFIGLDVKAAEAIKQGQITCLEVDGTDDGLSVALPSTANAHHAYAYAFGVARADIASGNIGEVVCFGFCRKVMVRKNTRAASSDSWSSQSAVSAHQILLIDTVNNCLSASGTEDTGSVAPANYLPFAVLVDSWASQAGSASTTSNSNTAITALVQAFLRMM